MDVAVIPPGTGGMGGAMLDAIPAGGNAGGHLDGSAAGGAGGHAIDAAVDSGTDGAAAVDARDARQEPADVLDALPDASGDTALGSVPKELVGIWQQTRSSAGDYTNGYGENFTISSGFSVQLKIHPNGSYYWAHFASGVSATCRTVSYFDQSVGVAVLRGTTLTLYPSERRLDVTDCTSSGSRTLPNDPIDLTVGLKESRLYYGGLRTYVMSVDGASHPLDLTLLHRVPDYTPTQPSQPATFVAGQDEPYSEWQGLWVAANGTDSNFYDPATGKYYFPELNGSPHRWLRFGGSEYDFAVALQNLNAEGVCKADLIYYERGKALLGVLEDVGGQGNHFLGHGRFVASAAHLIVRVRECDQDNAVHEYDLPPLTAYYRWIYFASGPESISLDCNTFAQNEWQSMLCTDSMPGFSRRR